MLLYPFLSTAWVASPGAVMLNKWRKKVQMGPAIGAWGGSVYCESIKKFSFVMVCQKLGWFSSVTGGRRAC